MIRLIIISLLLTGCKWGEFDYNYNVSGSVDCSGEIVIAVDEEFIAALSAFSVDHPELYLEYFNETGGEIVGPIHKTVSADEML